MHRIRTRSAINPAQQALRLPREPANGVGFQDVIAQRLAGSTELGGRVRLLSQILVGQPLDLLLELRERSNRIGDAEDVYGVEPGIPSLAI